MRCFFHLQGRASSLLDEEGVEISDSGQALRQALLDVLDVLYREPDTDEWDGWKLQVVDAGGNLLFFVALDGLAGSLIDQGGFSSLPDAFADVGRPGVAARSGERRRDRKPSAEDGSF